jgi:NAD(P)-dependent dehydrogenase (short-subunit alcohol dehydrogenase family)
MNTSTDIAADAVTTDAITDVGHSRGRNFDVRDKVVIITGAGQGIGREYARQFAAAGAIPVIAERNAESAESVAKEIVAEGHQALAVTTDVADETSVAALVERVVDTYGRVDVLVNNAAIFASLAMRPFEEIPVQEWRTVLDVNITGPYLCTKAVAPHMRAQGSGVVINVMSGAVPLGVPNYLHYVTSKSAMVGMTNSLAKELGADGITVNAVQPGATFTEVPRQTLTEEGKARLLANQCINRPGVPTDLVGLVIFLSSPAASFISGQTIACDGGLTHR